MDQAQEVMEIIDDLYSMVSEAWGVPLGNEKCIVDRDKILSLLDEMKDKLPSELAEARRLVQTRNEFITNAKHEAEGIRHQAEERARQLVSEQEIVRVAEARSHEMMATTEQQVRALRQAASEFCANALANTENAIAAAQQETHNTIAAALQQSNSTLAAALQSVQGTRAAVANAFAAAEKKQQPAAPAQEAVEESPVV